VNGQKDLSIAGELEVRTEDPNHGTAYAFDVQSPAEDVRFGVEVPAPDFVSDYHDRRPADGILC
jgi:hypothetical protein